MRDIVATIQVIEEGGMYFDEPEKVDGRNEIKGIVMKILEGTTVLGLSRTSGLAPLGDLDTNAGEEPTKTCALLSKHDISSQANLSSAVCGMIYIVNMVQCHLLRGLWRIGQWILVQIDLIFKNLIVMALMEPEKTVKWHGSLVARLLLEDYNLPILFPTGI